MLFITARNLRLYIVLCSISLLHACASNYEQQAPDLVELPKTWQQAGHNYSSELSWQSLMQAPSLDALIVYATQHNHQLEQQRLELEIAKTQLYQANMRYVPELDARVSATRGQPIENGPTTNSFSAGLDMSYELNIWGQVTDNKRAAAMRVAAAQASYDEAKRQLTTDIAIAWANVIESQKLVRFGDKRLAMLGNNLSIIESGYRSGLNSALEVYLARNDVEGERSGLEKAKQTLSDARRELNIQLGDYPSDQYQAPKDFPDTSVLLPPELPSELLMRRPDLNAVWLNLLASNSDLAVAHKARFPSLRLTASGGSTSAELGEVLSSGNLSWSIGASLLQPLLDSGRLKSNEDAARLRLEQNESRYTETVYRAFQEIESLLQNQDSLAKQTNHVQQSRDNAVIAEKLGFDQYLKGIVSYTTVLDAQRRALDAEVRLISLQKQIFENKVRLHKALAGELNFADNSAPKDKYEQ
ncbi:TolC family protein [Agaribacterium sp. ZY112]|uniref:TolC family protein n=1 Tax=Agaribacterium sp. ZY112 TaxID=3233574 RepID=UPI0035251900